MVCDRCLIVVKQQLEQLNLTVTEAVLGKVSLAENLQEFELAKIRSALKLVGFELIDEVRSQLVNEIKTIIIQQVHHTDASKMNVNYSSLISSKLNKDYAYLSNLFSDSEDITIEKYIIQQKIKKVKELIEYGQQNLNEIADTLGYSSSAHLSTQFKKTTGLTPSQYRDNQNFHRDPIDKI